VPRVRAHRGELMDRQKQHVSLKRVKDNLAKSGALSPSGKKALSEEGMGCETALADATETPAERPKKQGKQPPRQKIGA